MSFFPASFLASPSSAARPSSPSPSSYHPLFRFLDDFEQHSQQSRNTSNSTTNNNETHPQRQHQRLTNMKTFSPKFDVVESAEGYELHGDLPGIEQENVEIEFTDVQTITVRGRTERSYTSGTPPSATAIEGGKEKAAIEDTKSATGSPKITPKSPTVEDEDADSVLVNEPSSASKTDSNTTSSSSLTTTMPAKDTTLANKTETKKPEPKYWVSERSVGEFSRSFTFPVRVDQEGVTASMKNGVLSIKVPKAKKHEVRRIKIGSL